MEESNITIGGNKLTKEEVKRDEDFGQLLKKHQQFVRKKKWIAGGLIVAGVFLILALVLYFNSLKQEKNEVEITNTGLTEEKSITPVFNIQLDKKEFLIDSDKGGILSYNNTLIEIPEQAFVDSSGNKITGEVSIFYKEFHNPVDFFISGIPMTYDSAGTEYHFESAGMFDIRGEQNDKPIFLDKSITVKLASQQPGEYFNKYFYDEEKGKWEFIAKDEVFNDELSDTHVTKTDKREIEELERVESKIAVLKKIEPSKKSQGSICIKLEMDSTKFPQFRGFKDMLFEIDDSDNNFSEDLADVEWDDIKLRKKDEIFELLFFKKFKKTTLRTKPVYEGGNYKKAMAIYSSKNGEILESLNKEKDRLIGSISRFNNEVRSNSNLGNFVTRIFEINNFGIYNSDYPCRMPKGQLIAAEFLKKSDKSKKDTLKLKQLYLVEENKNIMYTLFINGSISYNPNNKCVLWGVTRDDKLVICKAKEFAKIPLNYKGIYNLEFEVVEKDLYAEEKIKQELDIDALF